MPSQQMPDTTGSRPPTASATTRVASLLRRQGEDLAGMPVGDEAADALVTGEPGRVTAQLRLVDGEVLIERKLHGGKDAAVVPFAGHHGPSG
jgi:hypothetical protein